MSIGRGKIVPIHISIAQKQTLAHGSVAQKKPRDKKSAVQKDTPNNQLIAQTQISGNQSVGQTRITKEKKFSWSKFHSFHIKHELKDVSVESIVFRGVSVVLWLVCTVIDTFSYSRALNTLPAKLFFGCKAPLYDVATVLYASGSASFGISYEIYILSPLAITNFILTLCNCDERQKIIAGLWLLKTACLFIAAQFCYYNFKRINGYKENFSKATSYMMIHALIFAVIMIIRMAPGLQAVYNSVMGVCSYTIARCNVIELYEPLFNLTDYCGDSYKQYIVGREELRILRNFLLIHIASYALYNRSFLAFSWERSDVRMKLHYFARLLLLLTFISMSFSVAITNMAPFEFPKLKIKLAFDIIEFLIFLIGILMLILNWRFDQLTYKITGVMCTTPDIITFG